MTSSSQPAWLPQARKIVTEFEGCSLKSYPDPGTNGEPWTIGYGHTGPEVKPNLTISKAMAEGFLVIDLKRAADDMFRLLPTAEGFTPNQQAALISFVFNVGSGAFEESTLRKRLIEGKDQASVIVAEELPRWVKGGDGKILPGLTRRRRAEVLLFRATPVMTEVTRPNKPQPDVPIWPAGIVGPRKRPDLKSGDTHIIANDVWEKMSAYDSSGNKLWEIPCLCRGQGKESEWEDKGEDTPPGLYLVGKVYRDYEENANPDFNETLRSYGWYSFDLEGQEGQEGPGSRYGRDGIMLHGGGSACGWPGAWVPRQQLYPTLGCIRIYNVDLRDKILPLIGSGRIWISVLQEVKE